MTTISRGGLALLSRMAASSARPAALPSRASQLRRRHFSSDDESRRLTSLIGSLNSKKPEVDPSKAPVADHVSATLSYHAAATQDFTPSHHDAAGAHDAGLSDAGESLPPRPPPLLPRSAPMSWANDHSTGVRHDYDPTDPANYDYGAVAPSQYEYDAVAPAKHEYDAVAPAKHGIVDIDGIIKAGGGEYANTWDLRDVDPTILPKVHTKIVSGRTVFLYARGVPNRASTAALAFGALDRLCREQKTYRKFQSQRFHERPGLKRKRLRSSRWRVRFKKGFQATVNRVMDLKKQGW